MKSVSLLLVLAFILTKTKGAILSSPTLVTEDIVDVSRKAVSTLRKYYLKESLMVCHLISLQPILKQEKEFPWKLFQTAEHQEILRDKRVGPGNAKRYRGRPTYIKGALVPLILLFAYLLCGRRIR